MRPPRELLRSGARVAVPTYPLARRVASLEVAVRENAALAVPLAEQVRRLEQSLLPLLEPARDSAVDPAGPPAADAAADAADDAADDEGGS
ncbi:MAG TPA: hypothetical protein VHR35_03530 [Nocardioides sp.]|nr:hypothetical protein [Nocardioides sp.]